MRILFNEIKKILNWKILLLLLFTNIIVFFLFIEFHISYFPNGRPALDSYRIGIEMIDAYGTSMDEEDFTDFKQTYAAQIEEADHYIQSRKEFTDAGIESYADFLNIDRDNEAHTALNDKVMFEESIDLFWELQSRMSLIEIHDNREASVVHDTDAVNAQQKERFDQLLETGKYQVYPGVVMENFNDYIFNVAIAVIISVVLVISPVFINDRSRQLLDLQYTMKKGRGLYKTKAAAALICTFIVITTLLIVYFSFYSLNNTSTYFDVPIHTFIGDFYWYDPTFFQYIVLTVIAIYVLGFVFALLAMSFSSVMPNYIALIGIQLPLVIAVLAYGLSYLLVRMISIWVPQWVVPTAYSVMVAVSVAFIMLMWKRERVRDILA